MIDLLLNEKSLDGQFATIEEFSERGVVGLLAVLEDQRRLSESVILYKSEAISEAKVTSTQTYPDVVFGEESRIYEGIRRYKVQLMSLMDDPYWNDDSRQNHNDHYVDAEGRSLDGTSIAECEARNGILVSFAHPSYSEEKIAIRKNGEEAMVRNVWREGQYLEATYQKAFIKFKEYVALKFEGEKLDFSKATVGKVWDVIPENLESLVGDAFDTFCRESWYEIPRDRGLGFKPYNRTRMNSHYFTADEWKKGIKEFRLSGKCRCFGYAEGGKFYLLMIDLGHVLGDK